MSRLLFHIKPDGDSQRKSERIEIQAGEVNKKQIDDRIEDLGFPSKAAGYRYFINLGMNAYAETDPRNVEAKETDGYTPLTLRDVLPEDKENALDLRDEVLERIEDELLQEAQNDPKIQIEGWNAWLNR